MRTMFDAVTAGNILAHDRTPEMVAGYIDKIKLEPWSARDWALFPDAVKVTIVKKASTNDGHVLDVEPGDATPAEAPGWVKRRRAAGADPTIYVQKSTWATVQQAFRDQGVAQPNYWIAHYNGAVELPTLNGITAVAKQYRGDVAPGVDFSCVADFWPGVDRAVQTEREDEDMAGLLDHEYPPQTARQFHHRAIQTKTDSAAVAGGTWFELSSGYQDITDLVLYFNGYKEPIKIARIPKDQPMQWRVPEGCDSVSFDYLCTGPSSSLMIYGAKGVRE